MLDGCTLSNSLIVCMLHCLMRMNEKIFFLLYFAAMKRCLGDPSERNIVMDLLTIKIRSIGDLSAQWKHTLGKDKHGNDKLLPLKMDYDNPNEFSISERLLGSTKLLISQSAQCLKRLGTMLVKLCPMTTTSGVLSLSRT